MPAYINHILMTKDTLKKEDNYLTTFSLAGDLTKFSKVRYKSHHELEEDFIYHMADYIKINKEKNNTYLLNTLYAHICHYIMDKTIHPLIRKVSKECTKVSINNHTMIEFYYDEFLLEKKYNINYSQFKTNKLLSAKVKNVSKMIDYAYEKTYHIKHISNFYKLNILLYKSINILKIFPIKNILIRLFNYKKFIKINKDKLKEKEYFNLYNKSIEESIKYIEKINKYIENN